MSDKRYLGNIITPTPTAPTGDAAKGVWSLSEALNYRKALDWPTLPQAPVIGTAAAGSSVATVPFTAPSLEGGTLVEFTATSNPEAITGTAGSSPITVTGLTNGTPYTFTVTATTGAGTSPASAASNSVTPTRLERILYFGGTNGATTLNVIEYIDPTTTGNGTDFGDLSSTSNGWGGLGSDTRAVMAVSGNMRFVTFASTGNTSNFGDLNFNSGSMYGGGSNTRGLFVSGGFTNIDFITIASTGNASGFGNLSAAADDSPCVLSGSTRSVFGKVGASSGGGTSNVIEFVTTATEGNSSDFGDLSGGTRKQRLGGASSATRGLFAGGFRSFPSIVYYNVIEYITIATTGDTEDFGDLSLALDAGAFGSGSTRAVFAGGYTGAVRVNVIQYVTIASTGSAIDFGDLTAAKSNIGSASSVHGGNA